MSIPQELLLIDKPSGITSMDVIRRLRKQLHIKKIGHAGTLDPLATGLLLIGVGPGTKALTKLVKLDKEYVAEIRIGESRTTGDLEGRVIASKDASVLSQEEVEQCLRDMVGTHELPVSAYSAIKKDGVPMYKRARQAEKHGEVVTDVPVREMTVHEVALLTFRPGVLAVAQVRFLVSSGTYIRSLAEEVGGRLGYPATIQSLRRTKVGPYSIEDADSI